MVVHCFFNTLAPNGYNPTAMDPTELYVYGIIKVFNSNSEIGRETGNR